MYIEKTIDIYVNEDDFTTDELINELSQRKLNRQQLKLIENLLDKKIIYDLSINTTKEQLERSSSDARTVLTDLLAISHHASNEQIINEIKNIL